MAMVWRWPAISPADCVRMRQMKGHGSKFGRKKEEAIAALLTQRNIEEAARSIGVAPNTLLKWQKLAEFETAYRAATTLLKTLIDPGTPALREGASSRGDLQSRGESDRN